MKSLRKMVGDNIVVRIPVLDKRNLIVVRLHAVESHGLWIEHQGFTDKMMNRFNMTSSTTTPVLFVPLAHIHFVLAAVNCLCLSEQAFGLHDEAEL